MLDLKVIDICANSGGGIFKQGKEKFSEVDTYTSSLAKGKPGSNMKMLWKKLVHKFWWNTREACGKIQRENDVITVCIIQKSPLDIQSKLMQDMHLDSGSSGPCRIGIASEILPITNISYGRVLNQNGRGFVSRPIRALMF